MTGWLLTKPTAWAVGLVKSEFSAEALATTRTTLTSPRPAAPWWTKARKSTGPLLLDFLYQGLECLKINLSGGLDRRALVGELRALRQLFDQCPE